MISKISIKNVKGIGNPGLSLNLDQQEIREKKINLFIAPNGFGKSSFSIAMDQLNKPRIELDEKYWYMKDESNKPFIEMDIDGKNYTADENGNSIRNVLETFVINSPVKANAKAKSFGDGFNTIGQLAVRSVVLKQTVPEKISLPYCFANVQKLFGANSKLLKSLSSNLKQNNFLSKFSQIIEALLKFELPQRESLVKSIVNKINAEKGTADQIKANIGGNFFIEINSDKFYNQFLNTFNDSGLFSSPLEAFLLFFQLRYLCSLDRDVFRKASIRAKFELQLDKLNESLKMLNTSHNEIKAKESKGKLEVEYPLADYLSNGQRDLLYFFCRLEEFKLRYNKNKKYLLVIDEIFDYLDDANYVAAQYFLSTLINEVRNIYVVLLTHLDPHYFRSTVFKDNLLNIVYLKQSTPKCTANMAAFITLREELDRNNPKDEILYNDMSAHYMHYHPQIKDIKGELAARTTSKKGLKSSWGDGQTYFSYLVENINNYFSDNDDYDPYAVATALRIRMEKNIYKQLSSANQSFFLSDKTCHKTKDKFKYAEEHGINVNDLFYMCIPITNDADHLAYIKGTNQLEEHALIYKIDHPVMKNIIKKIFDYSSSPITIDSIH